MSGDQIAGILRAVLAAGGGYLIGKGVIDAESYGAISGAAVTLAVAVWSFWAKKQSKAA